ncbi:MAG TPA: hypothetical protein VMD25_04115 [Acidobacteriaceae bacterium]|nr:hypothetical protein [Acidobacteriaceae bacterium]
MDKPRHPQVIRPWKTREIQTRKLFAGTAHLPEAGRLTGKPMRRAMPRNPKHE